MQDDDDDVLNTTRVFSNECATSLQWSTMGVRNFVFQHSRFVVDVLCAYNFPISGSFRSWFR